MDDFPPWEKEYLLPFARAMTDRIGGAFEVASSVRSAPRSVSRPKDGSATWIISRDWRQSAVRFGKGLGQSRLYLSVIHNSVGSESPFQAFWHRVTHAIQSRITLVTHHPMTLRYLHEMERVPEKQLVDLPLPFPEFVELAPRGVSACGIIGTLSDLDGNSNLNFIALLAHRLLQSNPNLRFRVLGEGPLRTHLSAIARELDLGERFDISPVARLSDITQWDAFVFAPLRCDHLIAPLIAIAAQVPTVCMETPGLEEWFGGLAVPLVPLYETGVMAKSVEELIESAPARTHNRLALTHGLRERLSLQKVARLYGRTFGIPDYPMVSKAVA